MLIFHNVSAYLANLHVSFLFSLWEIRSLLSVVRSQSKKNPCRYVRFVELPSRSLRLCERKFCWYYKVLYLCVVKLKQN